MQVEETRDNHHGRLRERVCTKCGRKTVTIEVAYDPRAGLGRSLDALRAAIVPR